MKVKNMFSLLCSVLLLQATNLTARTDEAFQSFRFPDTPAGRLYASFIKAYNSGEVMELQNFVKTQYDNEGEASVNLKTESWMDYYYRFGKLEPRQLSIDKPYDLEIWLQGSTSRVWVAIEFILDKTTGKIRAVGNIQGVQPPDVNTPSRNEGEMIERLESYLNDQESARLFQGNLLLMKEGELLFEKAYGYKNRKVNEKNTTQTRMRLASVTKMFTGVAILQLVQKRKLSLHVPISQYLPDYPAHITDQITLHDLLTHTAGFELDGIAGFREALGKAKNLAELSKIQLQYLPKWEHYDSFKNPGKFNYSNDDYDLLAIILEKETGMSFPNYLQQHIFDIAGLKQTSFSTKDVAIPYRYDLKANKLINHESYYPTNNISGAFGLVSTPKDLIRFLRLVFETELLLDLPFRSLLIAPHVRVSSDEYYGYGFRTNYDLALNIGHGGTNVANKSELRYFPRHGYMLAILSNNRSGAQNVAQYLKNILPAKQ